MLLLNARAERRIYDASLRSILNLAAGRESRAWMSHWQPLGGRPTPAWSLPGTAATFGIGTLVIKDESVRGTLGSFKALGAPVALVRLVLRRFSWRNWTAAGVFAGDHAQQLRDFVVIAATDGNHGRALAAAAQSVGCRCVIVLHAKVSRERENAIAALGAQIVRIEGNYDQSVAEAARLAQRNGWEVVSDTSYVDYEEIPRDVMQGYGIIVDELIEAGDSQRRPFTHVIVQGGVGGLAAAVVSNFWERYGADRPVFIVAEPEQADCLYQSALRGVPAQASGSVDSVMAGLACGEASPLAWRFLERTVDAFMTIGDAQAEAAMRTLAAGSHGDIPIVSGESGAAGYAALAALVEQPEWKKDVGLDERSCVLLVSTEGATAPGVYAAIVGCDDRSVFGAQREWLARNAERARSRSNQSRS